MKTKILFFILTIVKTVSAATSGEGTFYGEGGAGQAGACMLPKDFNNVRLTVAVPHALFNNGEACGKCLKIWGEGQGIGMTPIIGPYYATIDNLCPECKPGDIDFGLAGDGRWLIHWDLISCDEARNNNLRGRLF